jgi:hypothetical protein
LGLKWCRDKKKPWKEKAGPYSGEAFRDSDKDTLAELAKLITGHEEDANGLVLVGNKVDIKPLLQKLEDRLRENIEKAANAFTTPFQGSKTVGDANAVKILNANKMKNGVECFTGTVLVLGKGLITTITRKVFDAIPYTLYDIANTRTIRAGKLLFSEIKTAAGAEKGDWGYVKNYDDYDATKGPWAGENVITVGNNIFWGHGVGKTTIEELKTHLQKGYEEQKGIGNTGIGAIDWRGSIAFFDVAKIGMDVFDNRNK